MPSNDSLLDLAAETVARAEAMIIGAGAGMGVDSGLPDFRGPQGFWEAYPPYQKLGLNFTSMANPTWFERDPPMGWGFYGHRRNLYRKTTPHAGFDILRAWAERMRHGAFVFTSNVDGHFQKAGFAAERVLEVHGSVDWMQCLRRCSAGIYPAEPNDIDIDEATMCAREPLPHCPKCGAMARPNILMFNDWGWDDGRMTEQHQRLSEWSYSLGGARIVVVECGAGVAVPTVRHFCDGLAREGSTLIRINVREPEVPTGQIGLALGALAALREIDRRLGRA